MKKNFLLALIVALFVCLGATNAFSDVVATATGNLDMSQDVIAGDQQVFEVKSTITTRDAFGLNIDGTVAGNLTHAGLFGTGELQAEIYSLKSVGSDFTVITAQLGVMSSGSTIDGTAVASLATDGIFGPPGAATAILSGSQSQGGFYTFAGGRGAAWQASSSSALLTSKVGY